MTSLTVTTTTEPNPQASTPANTIRTIAAGLFGGLALGVVARAWMRFISDGPEFTWSGTIFILAAFTIFGITQSISTATRRRPHRQATRVIARVVGFAGLLPLFIGAGAMMLPTVVGGGLAVARTGWARRARAACLIVALIPVLVIGGFLAGTFGWSARTLLGFLAMIALYATIVRAGRATFAPPPSGLRLPR